jgi:hypothetical protein
MKTTICIAAVAATVVLAAGCGASAQSAAPAASKTSASSSAAPTPTPPSSSPAATVRLTVPQAKKLYPKLAAPANLADDLISSDASSEVPLSQFRADLAADDAAIQNLITGLDSHLWPKPVQPYITTITTSELPAAIACNKAYAQAGTYDAVNSIANENQKCLLSNNASNTDTVRSMLGLSAPPN